MRKLAFRTVTLHPTWMVWDGDRPRIASAAPDIPAMLNYARTLGFEVRLEPHLDYESTLSGGPYDWRRRMRIDPTGEYYDLVLAPLAELRPDALTLGSELDVSAAEFAEQWQSLIWRFPGVLLGHKFNHDAELDRNLALGNYLAHLDYAAFSFYPRDSFDSAARRIVRGLRKAAGDYPAFAIGEFGLGSSDLSRPWHFDASSFQSGDDFAARRNYYQQFLEWLAKQSETVEPVTFWTAGHFDFLGVMNLPEMERFRDDKLREEVRTYNLAQASPYLR